MANLIIPIPAKADLEKGIKKTYLDMIFATQDNEAHRVDVQLMRGKEQVNLSGAGISAYFIRYSDNATISLTGSASSNIASVTLKKACYNKPGQFALIIKAAIDGVISTVFYGEGSIFVSSTDTILDEENVVPSLADLLAQIAVMEAATKAANTATTNANTATSKANTATTNANNAAAKIDGMTASATKGTDASVTVSEKNGVKHFSFTLPKGDRGEKGETGSVENMPFYEGTPAAPGTASTGSSDMVSRGDHVHPLPQRLAYAYDNAYATVEKTASNRTHGLGVHDPGTGRSVGLYVSTDNGVPTIRYQDESGNVKQHGLYSTINKPTAGDVGALSKEGGTASGLIKATNFVLGNATDYPSIGFQGVDVSSGQLGSIQFSAPSDGRRFSFIQYPSDQDGKETRYLESYRLPKPSAGLTKTDYYDIYTTKNPPKASDVGAAAANHTHQTLKKTGGISQDMQLGFTDTDKEVGFYVGGSYSADDSTTVRMGIHVNKDTGVISARLDSKAGTWYPTFYTTGNKPTPADIGGFVGCHEVSVTSESIAAGQTGTASVTFTEITGAAKYYAVMCTTGTLWGIVTNVSISGTTLTVTFYNNSTGAHTIGTKILIIGVK